MQRALAPATTLPARPVRIRWRPDAARAAVAAVALLAALGACAWLVLAAAERPSVLSPPTIRAAHHWVLGPLSGALPHLTTDRVRLHADYSAALVVLLVAWLVAWATASALPVRIVGAAAAAAQVIFFLGPPQPLTDVFNYIVYGRMAAHGLNPYTHLPVSGPHGAAYALANWHHLPSPYGPLFTLLCEPLALLPLPVTFWVVKALIVGCSLATLWVVWWLARRLGRSPQRALACAGLCPATLALGIGGFHNDMPAVLCVVGAVACLVAARTEEGRRAMAFDVAAGVLIVVAAGLRPPFAVAVPLVVLGARQRLAAAAGAGGAAGVVGLVVGVAFGGALPALGLQGRLVTPLSIPNLLGAAAGRGGADATVRGAGRDVLVVIVLVASALVARRRGLAPAAIGVVLLAAVPTLAWVMPWYLAWSLPFVALATPRALVPAAAVTCLWLGVGATPQITQIIHAFGFFPTRSAVGLANHQLEQRLVH